MKGNHERKTRLLKYLCETHLNPISFDTKILSAVRKMTEAFAALRFRNLSSKRYACITSNLLVAQFKFNTFFNSVSVLPLAPKYANSNAWKVLYGEKKIFSFGDEFFKAFSMFSVNDCSPKYNLLRASLLGGCMLSFSDRHWPEHNVMNDRAKIAIVVMCDMVAISLQLKKKKKSYTQS